MLLYSTVVHFFVSNISYITVLFFSVVEHDLCILSYK
jgi:hypothetical protein